MTRRAEGPVVGVLLALMLAAVCSAATMVEVSKHYETPVVKRIEVCSPRSIDAYSPEELIGIGVMRRRLEKTK